MKRVIEIKVNIFLTFILSKFHEKWVEKWIYNSGLIHTKEEFLERLNCCKFFEFVLSKL